MRIARLCTGTAIIPFPVFARGTQIKEKFLAPKNPLESQASQLRRSHEGHGRAPQDRHRFQEQSEPAR